MSGGIERTDVDGTLERARELLNDRYLPAVMALARAEHDRHVIHELAEAARSTAVDDGSSAQVAMTQVQDAIRAAKSEGDQAVRDALAEARRVGWSRRDLAALGLAPSTRVGRPPGAGRQARAKPAQEDAQTSIGGAPVGTMEDRNVRSVNPAGERTGDGTNQISDLPVRRT